MAHGDTREGKLRGNWRMEWVASTLHTTSEHGVSSNTTADAHTSVVSSRLNWRPRRFKWTRPFRRKAKSGFCACAYTFQTQAKAAWSKKLAADVHLVLRLRMSGDTSIPVVSHMSLHGMEMTHSSLRLMLSRCGCSQQHNVWNDIRIFVNLCMRGVPCYLIVSFIIPDF